MYYLLLYFLQVIGIIGAHDQDENSGRFRFALAKKSSNFSLHDQLGELTDQ